MEIVASPYIKIILEVFQLSEVEGFLYTYIHNTHIYINVYIVCICMYMCVCVYVYTHTFTFIFKLVSMLNSVTVIFKAVLL